MNDTRDVFARWLASKREVSADPDFVRRVLQRIDAEGGQSSRASSGPLRSRVARIALSLAALVLGAARFVDLFRTLLAS